MLIDIGMTVSYFGISRLAPVQIATKLILRHGRIDYFLSADGQEPDSVAGNHTGTACPV